MGNAANKRTHRRSLTTLLSPSASKKKRSSGAYANHSSSPYAKRPHPHHHHHHPPTPPTRRLPRAATVTATITSFSQPRQRLLDCGQSLARQSCERCHMVYAPYDPLDIATHALYCPTIDPLSAIVYPESLVVSDSVLAEFMPPRRTIPLPPPSRFGMATDISSGQTMGGCRDRDRTDKDCILEITRSSSKAQWAKLMQVRPCVVGGCV